MGRAQGGALADTCATRNRTAHAVPAQPLLEYAFTIGGGSTGAPSATLNKLPCAIAHPMAIVRGGHGG